MTDKTVKKLEAELERYATKLYGKGVPDNCRTDFLAGGQVGYHLAIGEALTMREALLHIARGGEGSSPTERMLSMTEIAVNVLKGLGYLQGG